MRVSPPARDIGRRAKALREAAGLTLADVAGRANIDAGNLSKLENGKGPEYPGTKTLSRLALALGVPLSSLLDTSRAA